MLDRQERQLLLEVLSLPTAPFAERYVLSYIRSFCLARPGVTIKADASGNLLVRVRKGKRSIRRPVCLTAHLDHPGFIADRGAERGRLKAIWRGGVRAEYFQNAKVRFFENDRWHRGRVCSIKRDRAGRKDAVGSAVVEISGEVPPGSIGMWDLPDAAIRSSRIYSRACDDLAGVAAMLSCIQRLSRSRAVCDAYFLFTRAEEVGFVGALAACRLRTIPRKCFVVAVETSSELINARMGDGPILRVGDRSSVFSPAVTAYCQRVAERLVRRDIAKKGRSNRFCYQRKLMDGGSCEATAYCQLGYDATGMCLALGNYHNMDVRRGKIGSEYVNVHDYADLIDWFVALSRQQKAYNVEDEGLLGRLSGLEEQYRTLLDCTKGQLDD